MNSGSRDAILASYGILDTPPEPGFDDAVILAQHLCQAPVALVSLVADDRQWFKARVNFAECQTDLDQSICRFVVAARDVIVIPDLTADPRTVDNPLVAGDPGVRFYAGAPLIVRDGTVLGALCVLDTVPRPDGLTDEQTRQLAALARSVSHQLDLRRALLECDAAIIRHAEAEAHRQAGERRWGELFHAMQEGFIIGSLVRDASGAVIDWRYDEVNRAWGELVGIDHSAAVGRTIRDVFPGIEDEWVHEPAEAIARNTTLRFTRQIGALHRWYDGVMQPIGRDAFLMLFVEVTERIDSEHRLEALAAIADVIREARTISAMTAATARIVGQALRASRAGYGHVDEDARQVEIEPDWTADGETSIAGHYRFEDFGQIRDEIARAEPLVIDDVENDPRTAADPGPMRALNIGALVNMPVRESGRTIAVFIVQSAEPRRWSDTELLFIRAVADRLESGISRIRAELQQDLLNAEISHRLKNSLSMVQAIANQTLRGGDRATLETFQQRIRALGTAHEALLSRDVRSGELSDVVVRTLSAAGVDGRYLAEGPETVLGARATLSTSLLIHELATNAIKYGALSAPTGTLTVRWWTDGDDFALDWIERGGPPAYQPTAKGFGSRLISLGLVGTGGSALRYDDEGFSAQFRASREHLQSA